MEASAKQGLGMAQSVLDATRMERAKPYLETTEKQHAGYRLAALQGEASAQSSLGVMHYEFLSVRQDYAEEARFPLKAKPSEYIKSGAFYYAFELEETTLPYVMERVGSDKLLYASDYPHWDTSWPNSVATFTEREDVGEADKGRLPGLRTRRHSTGSRC